MDRIINSREEKNKKIEQKSLNEKLIVIAEEEIYAV